MNSQVLDCAPPTPPTANVKAKNLGGAKPKARLRVNAGSDQVKKVRFKVPKRLRFTSGAVFENGTSASDDSGPLDDDVLQRTARSVTVETPSAGTDLLKIMSSKGALAPTGKAGSNAFKIKITDVDGDVTKLTG